MHIFLILGLYAVDKIEQYTAAHVLEVDVQQRIMQTLGKVGDRLADVAEWKLLAHIVNVVGDNAARAGSQWFGRCVASAAEGSLVKKLTYIRKKILKRKLIQYLVGSAKIRKILTCP